MTMNSPEKMREFADWEEVPSCPVCGSPDHAAAYGKSVRVCKECEVLFRSPRPTQEEIKRSYDEGAQYADWATKANSLPLLWRQRMELVKKYIQQGRLLDIGVGDGRFLALAKESGFECEGTELSSTGGGMAQSKGFKVHYGQVTDIEFGEARFNVITMWHVLEHVPNPGEVLTKLWKLLEPGGYLIVAVPNEENSLFRHRLTKRTKNPLGELEWGTEIHLTHFQPSTLKVALKKHGFKLKNFGVDDIYHERSARNKVVLGGQKALNSVLEWHFSMAMLAVCRKEKA